MYFENPRERDSARVLRISEPIRAGVPATRSTEQLKIKEYKRVGPSVIQADGLKLATDVSVGGLDFFIPDQLPAIRIGQKFKQVRKREVRQGRGRPLSFQLT